MRDVAHILPPRRLIDGYEKTFAPGAPPHTQALWDDFATETGQVMAVGVRTLAMIWDAAWKAGGGKGDHGRIDPDALRGHYENPNFVRSVTVDDIEREIAHPSPLRASARARGRGLASVAGGGRRSGTSRRAIAPATLRTNTRRNARKKRAITAKKRRR
jgi:hypothetical protein